MDCIISVCFKIKLTNKKVSQFDDILLTHPLKTSSYLTLSTHPLNTLTLNTFSRNNTLSPITTPFDTGQFLLFDDTNIRMLGGWEDVKRQCIRSHLQVDGPPSSSLTPISDLFLLHLLTHLSPTPARACLPACSHAFVSHLLSHLSCPFAAGAVAV